MVLAGARIKPIPTSPPQAGDSLCPSRHARSLQSAQLGLLRAGSRLCPQKSTGALPLPPGVRAWELPAGPALPGQLWAEITQGRGGRESQEVTRGLVGGAQAREMAHRETEDRKREIVTEEGTWRLRSRVGGSQQRTQQRAEGGARDKDPEITPEMGTPTPRDTQATCSLTCCHPHHGHLCRRAEQAPKLTQQGAPLSPVAQRLGPSPGPRSQRGSRVGTQGPCSPEKPPTHPPSQGLIDKDRRQMQHPCPWGVCPERVTQAWQERCHHHACLGIRGRRLEDALHTTRRPPNLGAPTPHNHLLTRMSLWPQ